MAQMGLRKVLATENIDMSSKEKLDELKKATLASYINKASKDAVVNHGLGKEFKRDAEWSHNKADKIAAVHDVEDDADAAAKVVQHRSMADAENRLSQTFAKKATKRLKGVSMASKKLAKEEVSPIISQAKELYRSRTSPLNENNTDSHPNLWDTHALVHKSGKVLEKGAKIKGFRGTYKIQGFELPHHSGSTGRVYTDKGQFFPGVVDAKIVKKAVKEETQDDDEPGSGKYRDEWGRDTDEQDQWKKNVTGKKKNKKKDVKEEEIPVKTAAETYRAIREAKARRAMNRKDQ
jgi:hypothetical protein